VNKAIERQQFGKTRLQDGEYAGVAA